MELADPEAADPTLNAKDRRSVESAVNTLRLVA